MKQISALSSEKIDSGLRTSSSPKSVFPDCVTEIYGSHCIFYHGPIHTYLLSKMEKYVPELRKENCVFCVFACGL